MTQDDTFDRLTGIIIAMFPTVEKSALTRDTVSTDIEGWDSLANTLLLMGVEEDFGVELPTAESLALANVGALADLVDRVRG